MVITCSQCRAIHRWMRSLRVVLAQRNVSMREQSLLRWSCGCQESSVQKVAPILYGLAMDQIMTWSASPPCNHLLMDATQHKWVSIHIGSATRVWKMGSHCTPRTLSWKAMSTVTNVSMLINQYSIYFYLVRLMTVIFQIRHNNKSIFHGINGDYYFRSKWTVNG